MTSNRHFRFDLDALRKRAGDAAFARGQAYHAERRVEILSNSARRVVARVAGSEDYRVALTVEAGADFHSECSCPAFDDCGFCKHLVAVALAANEAGQDGTAEAVGPLDRIRRHLRAKSVDALVETVLELAERDATLFRNLDMAAASALENDDGLLRRLRAAIDGAIRTDTYIHYREVPGWAAEVEAILERIAGLVAEGRAGVALAAIEHALSRIEGSIQSIDDSDGHGGGLMVRARDIHLQACRAIGPDPVALARNLFARETEADFDTFHDAAALYADVLGDKGLAEYRALANAAWNALPAIAGGRRASDALASERWRLAPILDFFAERDGDVDTRIAIRAKDLSSQWRYLELAKLCLSEDREAEALRWAEEGLWQFEDEAPDERLVSFTVDLLSRAGRLDEAQAALWHAFERRPSLDLYRSLRRIGGEAARDRAIALLQARLVKEDPPNRWHSPADLLIGLFMTEAMFGEAWETVRKHSASKRLKESLAAASEGGHPREALRVYVERIDELVSAGGNPNYEEACRLVARAATLRPASEQWAHVADLKTRFKAKRNFMKLLEAQPARQ